MTDKGHKRDLERTLAQRDEATNEAKRVEGGVFEERGEAAHRHRFVRRGRVQISRVSIKVKRVVDGVADELCCAITQELPVDPVTAEDGKVYERAAITEWLSRKQSSPVTGVAMGSRLFEATQVRNTIEALVRSGAVEDGKARAWREKLADEAFVKDLRAKADGGDAESMWELGGHYHNGDHGLKDDQTLARIWFERSAAAGDATGMALYAGVLLEGIGGPSNSSLGLVNATQAAERGSSKGAFLLGFAFLHSKYGLPRDVARAREWLKKVVDGECVVKDLDTEGNSLEHAAHWLRECNNSFQNLQCPLTTALLVNPMVSRKCGHTYSKAAISYFRGGKKCAIFGCSAILTPSDFKRDVAKEAELKEYRR